MARWLLLIVGAIGRERIRGRWTLRRGARRMLLSERRLMRRRLRVNQMHLSRSFADCERQSLRRPLRRDVEARIVTQRGIVRAWFGCSRHSTLRRVRMLLLLTPVLRLMLQRTELRQMLLNQLLVRLLRALREERIIGVGVVARLVLRSAAALLLLMRVGCGGASAGTMRRHEAGARRACSASCCMAPPLICRLLSIIFCAEVGL